MRETALIALPWPENHYKFTFISDEGKISAEVSIALSKGGRDDRSEKEKKKAAIGNLKALVRALDATLAEMDA
jgi:hypothetical protein